MAAAFAPRRKNEVLDFVSHWWHRQTGEGQSSRYSGLERPERFSRIFGFACPMTEIWDVLS
jgi:hypothetical protein